MENFDAEQPMEDLQEQTPKKEPKIRSMTATRFA